MITGEDIDRCVMEQYSAYLADMTLDDAKEALRFAENDLEEVEGWIDALHAFIRIEEASIS